MAAGPVVAQVAHLVEAQRGVGQLPGVPGETEGGGLGDHRREVGAFGREPGRRPGGQPLGQAQRQRPAGCWAGPPAQVPARQPGVREVGEEQPGARGAGHGRLPGHRGLQPVGPLPAVEPHQVVQSVPGRAGLVGTGRDEQVRVEERVDGGVGHAGRPVEQRGDDPGGHVGDIEQAEPAQGPPGGVADSRIAHRERPAHGEVPGAQFVEAALGVVQPGGEVRERPVRAGREPGAGDPQGERYPGAGGGDLGERARLRPGTSRADQAAQ